jgi:hypothetical protein
LHGRTLMTYIHTHTHTHTSARAHTHTHMHTHICTRIRIRTRTHTHMRTHARCRWVRTVALPMFEGKEISNNLDGTLSIAEAARAAESDPDCCGFVRQIPENWYYWKRAGTGFSRIFRQDAASVSGDWETFYIEERVPASSVTTSDRYTAELAAQQHAEREGWEFHHRMILQNIKPSLKKHWREVCLSVCLSVGLSLCFSCVRVSLCTLSLICFAMFVCLCIFVCVCVCVVAF